MSASFTAEQLAQYRTRLRALAERLQGTTRSLADDALSPVGGEAGGGISGTPVHLADLGTATFDQEMDAAMMENEEHLLEDTIAAIGRIDAGTYGTCEGCGLAILPERLETLPYAQHCTPCAAKVGAGRPPININDGRPGPRVGLSHATGTDNHAAGTAGGGTGVGGLGGTTTGHGDPNAKLGAATGSGDFDAHNADQDDGEPNDVSENRRLD